MMCSGENYDKSKQNSAGSIRVIYLYSDLNTDYRNTGHLFQSKFWSALDMKYLNMLFMLFMKCRILLYPLLHIISKTNNMRVLHGVRDKEINEFLFQT